MSHAQLPQPSPSTSETQISSQKSVQQKLSWAHTQSFTAGSSQPGSPCATQQLLGHIAQPSGSTIAAHSAVHSLSQQLGIAAHTQAVMPGSSQPSPPLPSQQGPTGTGHIAQPRLSTSPTQISSHADSQQNASTTHTQSSICGLGQPGVCCTSQHASGPGPQLPHIRPSIPAAHSAVQTSEQHSGICSHTQTSIAGSLQPGTTPTSQHSPFGGGPPQSPQPSRSTLATQPRLQASAQHSGAAAHTHASAFTSSQPGASLATQQLLPPVSPPLDPLLLAPPLLLPPVSTVPVVPVLVSPLLLLVLVSLSLVGSPLVSDVVGVTVVVGGMVVGAPVVVTSSVLPPLLDPLSVTASSPRPQAPITRKDSARDQGRGAADILTVIRALARRGQPSLPQ